MMSTISSGKTAVETAASPDERMMEAIASWATLNSSVSSSIPLSTAACAKTNRTKHLTASSGFFSSVKLPQVLTTPMTKNRASRA